MIFRSPCESECLADTMGRKPFWMLSYRGSQSHHGSKSKHPPLCASSDMTASWLLWLPPLSTASLQSRFLRCFSRSTRTWERRASIVQPPIYTKLQAKALVAGQIRRYGYNDVGPQRFAFRAYIRVMAEARDSPRGDGGYGKHWSQGSTCRRSRCCSRSSVTAGPAACSTSCRLNGDVTGSTRRRAGTPLGSGCLPQCCAAFCCCCCCMNAVCCSCSSARRWSDRAS